MHSQETSIVEVPWMKAGSLVCGMGGGRVPGEGKDESKCNIGRR